MMHKKLWYNIVGFVACVVVAQCVQAAVPTFQWTEQNDILVTSPALAGRGGAVTIKIKDSAIKDSPQSVLDFINTSTNPCSVRDKSGNTLYHWLVCEAFAGKQQDEQKVQYAKAALDYFLWFMNGGSFGTGPNEIKIQDYYQYIAQVFPGLSLFCNCGDLSGAKEPLLNNLGQAPHDLLTDDQRTSFLGWVSKIYLDNNVIINSLLFCTLADVIQNFLFDGAFINGRSDLQAKVDMCERNCKIVGAQNLVAALVMQRIGQKRFEEHVNVLVGTDLAARIFIPEQVRNNLAAAARIFLASTDEKTIQALCSGQRSYLLPVLGGTGLVAIGLMGHWLSAKEQADQQHGKIDSVYGAAASDVLQQNEQQIREDKQEELLAQEEQNQP